MRKKIVSHVHATMRSATASAHRALDHHPLMQRLVESNLTREQYAESLAAMYRPHARLEQLVHDSSHHSGAGLELSARRKLLEADLLDLGWSAAPALPNPLEPVAGRAAWWGRVYVLEGSRLGGAVIARRIRSSLGDSVPIRFFGQAIAPDGFAALLVMLERALQGQDDLEQAVAGAQAAFGAYKAELDAFDGGKCGINEYARG